MRSKHPQDVCEWLEMEPLNSHPFKTFLGLIFGDRGLVSVVLEQEERGRNKAMSCNVRKSCCSYWSLKSVWNADLTS